MKFSNYRKLLLNSSLIFFKNSFEKRINFINKKIFLFEEISNFINNCIDQSKNIFFSVLEILQ